MTNRGINKVILIGNLGQDPEIRYTSNGNAITSINLATSEKWKDKQTNELKEKTEWHRVVFFGKLAEIAGEFLKKGSQVYVEGQLQTRKWKDQNDNNKYITEIIVSIKGTLKILNTKNNKNINDKSINNEESIIDNNISSTNNFDDEEDIHF